jgi:hypothetical protein
MRQHTNKINPSILFFYVASLRSLQPTSSLKTSTSVAMRNLQTSRATVDRFRPEKGSPYCTNFVAEWSTYTNDKGYLLPCRDDASSLPTFSTTTISTATLATKSQKSNTASPGSEMARTIGPTSMALSGPPTASYTMVTSQIPVLAKQTMSPSIVNPSSTNQSKTLPGATPMMPPTYSYTLPPTSVSSHTKPPIDGGGNSFEADGFALSLVEPRVTITLYVALPPLHPSITVPVIHVITEYLNNTMHQYNYHRSLTQEQSRQKSPLYDLYYKRSDSELVQRLNRTWFWQYNITYITYWAGLGGSIDDTATLKYMKADMTRALNKGVTTGTLVRLLRQTIMFKAVLLYTQLPNLDNYSWPFASWTPLTAASNKKRAGTYPSPVDFQQWTSRRYVGLGMFCVTMITV